ncbi:MAG: His-Xaa-Ser system protein HxsD [Bacteroidales bacterium]|nr:His-Xaa-Ser system protein HxsD [Bacteroidales bacterium]
MVDIKFDRDCLTVKVDITQYSDSIISRICYWLSANYLVLRQTSGDNTCLISIEPKTGILNESTYNKFAERINKDFNDYKLREIIREETKDIRNILYIKAFAHNDDFEDYTLNF